MNNCLNRCDAWRTCELLNEIIRSLQMWWYVMDGISGAKYAWRQLKIITNLFVSEDFRCGTLWNLRGRRSHKNECMRKIRNFQRTSLHVVRRYLNNFQPTKCTISSLEIGVFNKMLIQLVSVDFHFRLGSGFSLMHTLYRLCSVSAHTLYTYLPF